MRSLLLTSPNTASFHGKNAGTFGRKLSCFCPLAKKLQPKQPKLQSRQLAFVPPSHSSSGPRTRPRPLRPRSLWLSQRAVFSATCSRRSNAKIATQGGLIPYEGTLQFEHGGDAKTRSASKIGIGSRTLLERSQNEVKMYERCDVV